MNADLRRWFDRQLQYCATMLNIYTNKVTRNNRQEKRRVEQFHFWLGKLDAYRRVEVQLQKDWKVKNDGG